MQQVRKIVCTLVLATFVAACFALPLSFGQPDELTKTVTPQDSFAIPSANGSITFAMNGSYTNATLEDNIWMFSGLKLTGFSSFLPTVGGMKFNASAQDSNITITKLNPLNVFPPMGAGTLEYAVLGVGTQGFSVYYYPSWLSYSVQIDDVAKSENEGWNVTKEGWLTVTGATSHVKVEWSGRSPTAFSSSSRFDIPELNSSINFEGSGTYIFADLENGTWRFQNLALNGVVPRGAPHWALGISARDCNVTVTGYLAPFGTTGKGWLNYTVLGMGTQIFNGDIEQNANFPLNHTVFVDGERTQSSSWTIADGWMTVHAAGAYVSVDSEPVIPDWFWDMPPPGPVSTVVSSPTVASSTQEDSSTPPGQPVANLVPVLAIAGIIVVVIAVTVAISRAKFRSVSATTRKSSLVTALAICLLLTSLAAANPLIPPLINVDSPQNNRVYSSGTVQLDFTIVPDMPIKLTSFSYSLDGQPPVATNGTSTLTDLPSGSHSLAIYAAGSYFGGSEPYESKLTVIYFSVYYSTAWVVAVTLFVSAALAFSLLTFWKRKQIAASFKGKKEVKFWAGLGCFLFFTLVFLVPGVYFVINDYLFPRYSQSIVAISPWGIVLVCFFMTVGLFLMWMGTRRARSPAGLGSS